MIELLDVYMFDDNFRYKTLFDLLSERTAEQSISHKKMPTWFNHMKFVDSEPYDAWYFISSEDGTVVGSIYLTSMREIGIFIFDKFKRNGYGTQAVEEVRRLHPGRLLANVSPSNMNSHRLFNKLGAKQIQVTYEL